MITNGTSVGSTFSSYSFVSHISSFINHISHIISQGYAKRLIIPKITFRTYECESRALSTGQAMEMEIQMEMKMVRDMQTGCDTKGQEEIEERTGEERGAVELRREDKKKRVDAIEERAEVRWREWRR